MTPEVNERPPGETEAEPWSYGTSLERSPEASSEPMVGHVSDVESGDASKSPESSAQPDRPGGDKKPLPENNGAGHPGDTDKQDPKAEKKDEPPPPPPRKTIFVVVGLVLLAALAWGAYSHWRVNGAAETTQDNTANAVPEVRVTEAKRDDSPIPLTLPGQTEAFATANIYPRATGYITARKVDIGSRVHKGDLLVHITAPDLDQQLAQAKAQLGQVEAAQQQATAQVDQAQSNLNLAKVTLARTATLTQQGYETLQNRDNQVANQQVQQANVETAKAGVAVAVANTKAQQATVDRLAALAGFEDVVAPFDGIVTTRNVDLGDLVNADTSSATPIFSIARDDIIRVTVQVPQNASDGVRDGVPATIEVPSSPGLQLSGTVTRSSVALLSSARTLDTEVDVPNPDGKIRPGLFVYITMHIPRTHPAVVIPSEALIFNQNGMQVATLENDTAKLHEIKIDRDFGTSVSLSEGLKGGEQVVLSPPALLRDGEKVKLQKPSDDDQAGGKPPAGQQPGTKQSDGKQPDAKQPNAQKPDAQKPDAKQPADPKADGKTVPKDVSESDNRAMKGGGG